MGSGKHSVEKTSAFGCTFLVRWLLGTQEFSCGNRRVQSSHTLRILDLTDQSHFSGTLNGLGKHKCVHLYSDCNWPVVTAQLTKSKKEQFFEDSFLGKGFYFSLNCSFSPSLPLFLFLALLPSLLSFFSEYENLTPFSLSSSSYSCLSITSYVKIHYICAV